MSESFRRVEYNLEDMVEVTPTPHLNLSKIVEEKCYKPKDNDDYWLFLCAPKDTKGTFICMECGCHSPKRIQGYLSSRRLIHDVNCGTKKIDLLVSTPRYICQHCGKTVTHEFEDFVGSKQMTKRLYNIIRQEAFEGTFVDLAAKYGYSEPVIGEIFDEYAEELESKREAIKAPKILGIDEKHIVNHGRGVFVDIENGRLLEMTDNNKYDTVINTISNMEGYEDIQIVTMDMAAGYKSAVYELLPKAKIVVDHYHVAQDLSRKVTKSRTLVLEYLTTKLSTIPDEDEKKTMLLKLKNDVAKDSYLFKFGPDKLSHNPHRLSLIANLCREFPEFNHLRLLKEGFERIYLADTKEEAYRRYGDWIPLVPPVAKKKVEEWERTYHVKAELYGDFRQLLHTVNKWEVEIFNYFETGLRYSNAAAEGLNCLTERINRIGNGYSFKRLRAKALFWHEAIDRTKYSIDEIKEKVSNKPIKNLGMGYSQYGYGGDRIMPIVTIPRSYLSVKEEVEHLDRKPLSVFSYLPKEYELDKEYFIQ